MRKINIEKKIIDKTDLKKKNNIKCAWPFVTSNADSVRYMNRYEVCTRFKGKTDCLKLLLVEKEKKKYLAKRAIINNKGRRTHGFSAIYICRV